MPPAATHRLHPPTHRIPHPAFAPPPQQVLGWLKQRVPQAEQAALAAALRQVVADKLLQQLLLAWLAPDGGSGGAASGKGGAAGAAAAGRGAGAEPMALDGAPERPQQGAAPPPSVQQQGAAGGGDDFVCCRAAAGGGGGGGSGAHPCGSGKAGAGAGAANGCRYDRDLEECGVTPGSKPPLRVRGWAGRRVWPRRCPRLLYARQGPLGAALLGIPPCQCLICHPPPPQPAQEIYYFHQAIRSALHSFAAEARALRAAEGRVTTAQVGGRGGRSLEGWRAGAWRP